MFGLYRYRDKYDQIQATTYSEDIPEEAVDLITFIPANVPEPPHSVEDHAYIQSIRDEFSKVYERIYGKPPNSERELI